MDSTTQAALSLIEPALSAPDSREFDKALQLHGPLLAEEVRYLDDKSKSLDPLVRRNATRLLTTTIKGGALDVLRSRIADTSDAQVFIIALRGLLREPDAKKLAAARPELLAAALQDPDPQVLVIALRAAALADLPHLQEILAAALKNPDERVRGAALEVATQTNQKALEPLVKDALLHATKNAPYPFPAIYHRLSSSDDPGMAEVFRKSLQQTGELSAFLNGCADSRKPWLRGLLLDMAHRDTVERWSAFRILADWGSETEKELVALCVDLLDKTPMGDEVTRRRYLYDLEPCRDFLGKLASRQYNWDERDAMLDFARTRLRSYR